MLSVFCANPVNLLLKYIKLCKKLLFYRKQKGQRNMLNDTMRKQSKKLRMQENLQNKEPNLLKKKERKKERLKRALES
jgi:hypothetical protein